MAGQWGNADYVLRDRNEVKIRESIQDENSGWAFFVFKDGFFAGRGGRCPLRIWVGVGFRDVEGVVVWGFGWGWL